MGWWQAISSALRAARESKRGRASAGGVLAVTLGWVLGRLAGTTARGAARAGDRLHRERRAAAG